MQMDTAESQSPSLQQDRPLETTANNLDPCLHLAPHTTRYCYSETKSQVEFPIQQLDFPVLCASPLRLRSHGLSQPKPAHEVLVLDSVVR